MKNPAAGRLPVRLTWTVRLLLSGSILGLTLWFLPVHDVWETFRRAPLGLCLFVFILFLGGHVVTATKWWLLTGQGSDVAFTPALRAHFAGLAANLCLPSIAGGDVVRASLVARRTENKSRIAMGSVFDRLLDTLGLVGMAAVAAVLTTHDENSRPALTVAIAAAVILIGSCLGYAGLRFMGRMNRPIFQKLYAASSELGKKPMMLAVCLLLSLAVQSLFVLLNVLLATSAGIEIPVAAWFFAWPLAKLLAMVPISVGGLGVREASLAALLTPFGAAPAKVVAVGLLWQAILIFSGLVGGLALLLSKDSGHLNATTMRPEAEL